MADDEGVWQRQYHGLTRIVVSRQRRELLLHPGGGGSRGYPCWVQGIEITRVHGGFEPKE